MHNARAHTPHPACTQIVGQIKCHELVTKQRKRAQTGGKVDMASIGKAESGEHVTDELCYTIIHS
jgi:hypothetical protein